LAVAPTKSKTAAADSGAVPVVREAQRRSPTVTEIDHTIHRITANTGWARRSSAKADFELPRFLQATAVRRACAGTVQDVNA
jgi:hypothetical protein